MSVQKVEWSTSDDHVVPSSLTVTMSDGARHWYVLTGDAAERALKAGQDGYRLAEERAADQMREVVAIARSLKQCTKWSQVADLADVLIVRFGTAVDGEATPSDDRGAS